VQSRDRGKIETQCSPLEPPTHSCLHRATPFAYPPLLCFNESVTLTS
jgi:hypothetical protein